MTLTELQVWTLIGVFSGVVVGMLTIVTASFNRTLKAEIGSVRAELGAQIGSVRTEMVAMREVMDVRFASVEHRLDGLDRDVDALTRRMLGDGPG